MDLLLIAPELILLSFAVLVILADLALPEKETLPWLAGAGLGAALLALLFLGPTARGVAFGGVLAIDDFSVAFKVLFACAALLVVLASGDYQRLLRGSLGEYYALLLLVTAAMMLLASANELVTVYLSLETTTIGLAILAGLLRTGRSAEAGIKFLLLGALSSSVLLYGMAILFGLTGTTRIDDLAPLLIRGFEQNHAAILLGTVLLIGGFGFKLSAVPFQMWVPDVYEGAPTTVTAFLSVVSKAGGFAVVLRVFHTALGEAPLTVDWTVVFAALSAVSMTLGNVVAMQQQNIKRMMAYSSIAHAGYLLVGVTVVPLIGPGAVIFYLVSYALTNLGAFMAIIALSQRLESDFIHDYAGVWRRAPWLSLALALCLLSLTGIPPTAGFFAKLVIFNAGMQHGLVWLVVVGVINSVISSYYYIGVVRTMFLGVPSSEAPLRLSASMAVALVLAVGGTLVLGFLPGPAIDAAAMAAASVAP